MGEYGELRQKAHAENTTNLHIAGELGMHVFQARKAEIYFEPNNTDIDEVLSKTYLTMDVCGRRVVSAPLRLFDIDRDEGKLSLKLRIPVNICRHDSFRADFVVAPGLRLEGVNSMLTCVLRGVEVISGA